MPKDVICDRHGAQGPAFVCAHIFTSLTTRRAVGLTWFEEDDGDIQAFCDACWQADIEEFQKRTSGGPRLICLRCLDEVAKLNGTWLDFEQK